MQSAKVSEIQSEIIKTLVYADIFDYPLKEKEIYKWLISLVPLTSSYPPLTSLNLPLKSFNEDLSGLVKKGGIILTNGYYSLPSREKIFSIRSEREKWSLEKLQIATETAEKLKKFPWIKMIGITGALAMNNCQEDDDIDLMIITSKDCLWLTRLLLFILSPMWGIKRRKQKENNPKDKICFNLFLDEGHLLVEPENLFTAHEICQVIPLVNKEKIYERFLWQNQWVVKFLPNAVKISSKFKMQSAKLRKNHLISKYLNILISILDKLTFKLQYSYMKPKITNEKVSLNQAFFHPKRLEIEIEMQYIHRLEKYNLC